MQIVDEVQLRIAMQDTEHAIHIVSDGGVYNYEGSFGVVISDGIIPIANNNGKLYSVDFFESSYRSELYSMLAGILCFTTLQNKYHDESSSTCKTLFLISDHKTLIKKITNRRQLRRTVNQHTDSDVDLELQLIFEIKKLEDDGITINIQHIRSHQELKKQRSALSYNELLNVLADNLSIQARQFKSEANYISLPQNNIDLIINNDVINSKYATRSKVSFQCIPLRQYFQKKYKWSDKTIDSIWWKAYFNSLSQYNQPDRMKIFKFINDKLPTKARDNKYFEFRPQFCGQCQGELENEDHIIRCSSDSQKQIRSDWIKEIESYLLKAHTPIFFKHAIYDNLESWLEPTMNKITDICYPPQVAKALQTQNNLGWRNFIRGRISIEWGRIINEHKTNSETNDFKAETWGANLLQINWTYIIKLWTVRCEEVHGTTNNVVNIILKERMLEEIRHIQASNRELLPRDSEWLHEDMDNIDKYDNRALESWLYGAKIVAKINQRKLKEREKCNKNKSNRIHIFGVKTKDRRDLDPVELSLDS